MIFGDITGNGLYKDCCGFGALPCPPKPKLASERRPCSQPFTRHKLYAVLCSVFYFINSLEIKIGNISPTTQKIKLKIPDLINFKSIE